jgi:nucleoside-diphosphate-sugar epimerase
VRHSSLDAGRAAMQLGWQAWTPLETGLAAVIRFFAEQAG